jgi:hypothetical protein
MDDIVDIELLTTELEKLRCLAPIPDTIHSVLVPSDAIPVTRIVTSRTPPKAATAVGTTVSHYSSQLDQPFDDADIIAKLYDIPVPGKMMAQRILEEAIPKLQEGAIAFNIVTTTPRSSVLVPAWTLTWWLDVVKPVFSAKSVWTSVISSLTSRKGAEPYDSALESLEHLSWSNKLPFAVGNGDSPDTLAHYFTTQWLTCAHVEQMVSLVSSALIIHNVDVNVQPNSQFFMMLAQIYRGGKAQYKSLKDTHLLKDYATGLVRGQKPIALVINLMLSGSDASLPFEGQAGNHWVAIILVNEGGQIRVHHYDSLGYSLPKSVTDILSWWLEQHGWRRSGTQLTVTSTSGTRQTDTYSCGLLAVNSLGHFFLPAVFPLIDMDLVHEARIHMYLKIIDTMYQVVSVICKLSAMNLTHIVLECNRL